MDERFNPLKSESTSFCGELGGWFINTWNPEETARKFDESEHDQDKDFRKFPEYSGAR